MVSIGKLIAVKKFLFCLLYLINPIIIFLYGTEVPAIISSLFLSDINFLV
ncbi:unnamed protein product [Musa acuminata subsp. malaccensis]|uniref:(wild Malaysian banana) hypothetical protein n=1 Tax=Musa acuminata subsp. malaccensis TaxID=214687 RepID=A0A804KBR8_MUSAM|nr:unnamed protein product [Musa acuminata subsp. malaccensis]